MTEENVDLEKVNKKSNEVIKDILERFWDIPFENSLFQDTNFIINDAVTPQRAYRSIGLKLQAKIRALREAYYSYRKLDIEIKILKRKIETEHDELEKELLIIDLEKKQEDTGFTNKLINDAMVEMGYLYTILQKFPKYTREEFEQGEFEYFKEKLTRQVKGITGAPESLINMGFEVNQAGQLVYNKDKKTLIDQIEKGEVLQLYTEKEKNLIEE